MQLDKELEIALIAGISAGEICKKVSENLIADDVVEKHDKSPVTIADFASQAVICDKIKQNFPKDKIIAEEDSLYLKKRENKSVLKQIKKILKENHKKNIKEEEIFKFIDYGASKSISKRFWTIDPIDGTKGFLRKGQYAVAIGLIIDYEVKLGVLVCPNMGKNGKVYYAVKGKGSYGAELNNIKRKKLMRVDRGREKIKIVESVEKAHTNHKLTVLIAEKFKQKKKVIRIDSQAKYALVANGKSNLYLRLPRGKKYFEKIWDHAAGSLLVEEAGGIVSDIYGKKLDFSKSYRLIKNQGIVCATEKNLHRKIIGILKKL